jgi:hypothetical protein
MEWSRKRESGWNNLKGLWGWKIWTDNKKNYKKKKPNKENKYHDSSRFLFWIVDFPPPFLIWSRPFPFLQVLKKWKIKNLQRITHTNSQKLYLYTTIVFMIWFRPIILFLPQLFRLFYYSYITESFVSRYYVIYTSRQNKRISSNVDKIDYYSNR